MRLSIICGDRMKVVDFLASELGERVVYSGQPKFEYRVGEYRITRDGWVEADYIDWRCFRSGNFFNGF